LSKVTDILGGSGANHRAALALLGPLPEARRHSLPELPRGDPYARRTDSTRTRPGRVEKLPSRGPGC